MAPKGGPLLARLLVLDGANRGIDTSLSLYQKHDVACHPDEELLGTNAAKARPHRTHTSARLVLEWRLKPVVLFALLGLSSSEKGGAMRVQSFPAGSLLLRCPTSNP